MREKSIKKRKNKRTFHCMHTFKWHTKKDKKKKERKKERKEG